MNSEWVREERRLWDAMMDPGRGKPRVTVHSMPPGPVRNKLLQQGLQRQRERDAAYGWMMYEAWVRH